VEVLLDRTFSEGEREVDVFDYVGRWERAALGSEFLKEGFHDAAQLGNKGRPDVLLGEERGLFRVEVGEEVPSLFSDKEGQETGPEKLVR
jgi:hypothetical protein